MMNSFLFRKMSIRNSTFKLQERGCESSLNSSYPDNYYYKFNNQSLITLQEHKKINEKKRESIKKKILEEKRLAGIFK